MIIIDRIIKYLIIFSLILLIYQIEVCADVTKGDVIWKRKLSMGYNKNSGNTQNSQLSLNLFFDRNIRHVNEITLKGNIYYSSTARKMDAQKWYTSARYAFSFGKGKRWYNFYKIEADHDRFANIDYRVIPHIGVGYWFYDSVEVRLMTEVALGWEHCDYRDVTDDSNEGILVSRLFFEKEIYKGSNVSQDIYFYPAIDGLSDYRFHSETILSAPLNQRLSLSFSIIDDYDSKPPANTEKNDVRFISSFTYCF